MESIQKTIEIPYYVDKLSLLGPKDSFLNLIRQDTAVKIAVNNEEEISLYGPIDEVKRIESVLEKLMDIAANREPMTTNEVGILLNQSKNVDGIYRPQDDSLILKYGKKEIRTKTEGQQQYLNSLKNNDITICIGAPGTSKTFTAVCYGLALLVNKEIDRIIITRPMVEAKGENSLGSLPGQVNEKLGLWVLPMIDIFERVLGKEKLEAYMESGKIKMMPVGYMRGISLKNSYLLVDESANLNITLAKLVVTRLGEASKIVVCGDPIQQDSYGDSGLVYLAESLKNIGGIGIISMKESDIVRHPLIPKILNAFKEYDRKNEKARIPSGGESW